MFFEGKDSAVFLGNCSVFILVLKKVVVLVSFYHLSNVQVMQHNMLL